MPTRRANKGSRPDNDTGAQPWWIKQRKRQRIRNKMAKASRRKNRK